MGGGQVSSRFSGGFSGSDQTMSNSDMKKRAVAALATLKQALADLAEDDRIPLSEKEDLIGHDYLFVQGERGLPSGYRPDNNSLKRKENV